MSVARGVAASVHREVQEMAKANLRSVKFGLCHCEVMKIVGSASIKIAVRSRY